MIASGWTRKTGRPEFVVRPQSVLRRDILGLKAIHYLGEERQPQVSMDAHRPVTGTGTGHPAGASAADGWRPTEVVAAWLELDGTDMSGHDLAQCRCN